MIKPWVFEFFTVLDDANDQRSDTQRWADAYAWYQQLWQTFEPVGFEGVFFSEHHFMPGRLSPSPNLLIAHLAARTRTLRLGVMGMVAPMYAPWRLAEEVGMLDQLSGGRLDIGLSSGTGPKEYKAVGIAAEEIRPRFDEIMDFLDKALTQPEFSHHGQFWQFDHLAISPRPVQQPRPPCWMTGHSVHAAAAAARRQYRFCTAFVSLSDINTYFTAYREAAAASGREATVDDLGIRRKIIITDDDSEGREIARNVVAHWRKVMSGPPPAQQQGHGVPKAVVPDAPKAAHGQHIADEEAIGGAPANVAEQIIEQCRATGAGHMLAYTFGKLTRQQLERNFQLWAQVIPILRKAQVVLPVQSPRQAAQG